MNGETKKEFLSLLSQVSAHNKETVREKRKLLETRLILIRRLDASLRVFINGTDISLSKENQRIEEIDTFLPAGTILTLGDRSIEFHINETRSSNTELIIDITLVDKERGRLWIGRLEKNNTKCHFYDPQDRLRSFNEASFYSYIAVCLLPKKL